MPSNYTPRERLELLQTGEAIDVWGDKTNANLLRLEEAIDGVLSFMVDGAKTLLSTNSASDEAHYAVLNVTGGAGGVVTLPTVQKVYAVRLAPGVTGPVTFTAGGAQAIVHPGEIVPLLVAGGDCFRPDHFRGFIGPTEASDLANKAYVDAQAFQAQTGNFPGQTGHNGHFLKTNGAAISWAQITIADVLSLQTTLDSAASTTNAAIDAFKTQVNSAVAAFELSVNNTNTTFRDSITAQQNAFQAQIGSQILAAAQGNVIVDITSADVTLTPTQAASPIISIHGSIARDAVVTFPLLQSGWWLVRNFTTGTGKVSCKLPNDGAVVSIARGKTRGLVTGGGGGMNVAETDFTDILASPDFTGSPTADTPPIDDASRRLATTAGVKARGFAFAGSAVLSATPLTRASCALLNYVLTGGFDVTLPTPADCPAGAILALTHVGTSSVGLIGSITGAGGATLYPGEKLILMSDGSSTWGEVMRAQVSIATTAEVRAAARSRKPVTAGALFDAAAFVTLADNASITPDFDAGLNFSVTLGGARSLAAPLNAKDGQAGIIVVRQDATGGRTLAANGAYKFPGGMPGLTSTANAIDVISYVVVSGVLLCTLIQNFV